QNKLNLEIILKPLDEKIKSFEKKVEETYEKGLKDQTDLQAELKKLHDLNSKISEDASNLTKALKGDVKKQGNWGEVILERILERSGLTKGSEYETQYNTVNDEGKRIQPDVVIYLPDKKHLIIDSKVSLVAYENYVNTDEKKEKEKLAKAHVLSVKSHIKELSEKHYESSKELNNPDFVLLFIPIEASFSIAVQTDNDMFNYAWSRKVVIVSPSTLLATLLTISSIWKQKNQTKNALEIAEQGGKLYDKFAAFVEDLTKLGKKLGEAQNSYDASMKKLKTGHGSLLKKSEDLKQLGIITKKSLPDEFLEEDTKSLHEPKKS
ncbi:DNA recombination protein RmuC, partial [Bacteroidota bacterium]